MSQFKFIRLILITACFVFTFFSALPVFAQQKTGKPPVIIIPGILGSELVNGKTKEVVWFRSLRSKNDDLRLPISPNLARNRDSLVARDVLRGIKTVRFLPEIEIYQKLIDFLKNRGGYQEGGWSSPPVNGYEDTFYVFQYDWRRDNVENARLLNRQIEDLKRKLKRPDLKFNLVAHSMGGLIARYAAMYGNADLAAGNAKFRPNWAGARNLDKIFLLGTPNEGSVLALDSLLNGIALGGIRFNLPFIQNLTKFDLFTIPAIYQLLPHSGAIRAFDENLQPLEINVFDVKTWEKYNWGALNDRNFSKNFSAAEQKNAKAYFSAVLNRAKRFQEALNAESIGKTPVTFYLIGADCRDTLDSMLIYRDAKRDAWKTVFKDESFKRENGEIVSKEELKKLMFAPGDGVVTNRSLKAGTLSAARVILPVKSEIFQCEAHNRLVTNVLIQDKILALLQGIEED